MQTALSPTRLPEWTALSQHFAEARHWQLRDLFQRDSQRFQHFLLSAPGLTWDGSRHLIDARTVDHLVRLAERMQLAPAIAALFAGETVNVTEQRAAWHTALRASARSSVSTEVETTLTRMQALAEAVHQQRLLGYSGRPIQTVINIGIGGSDLGPKMVTEALRGLHSGSVRSLFVSNLDLLDLQACLAQADPETTLFIIASKTFTTRETLVNLTVAREWLQQAAGSRDIGSQFVAVTAAPARAQAQGFSTEFIYPFWDWVGGRFSVWSAVGLSIAISFGMPVFRELLAGAAAMDEHFRTTPFAQNVPVMMGLLAVWYSNFWQCQTQAIIPYSQRLALFPDYLQQLCMESLGKSVRFDGSAVEYATGGIIWGGLGTNSQHSFHQLLLQGTHKVPTDFIVPLRSAAPGHNQAEMIAHCLAQSEVFAFGYNPTATEASDAERPHQKIAGSQPHGIIMLDSLSPYSVGALIALYEHKVYTQSVIWQINAFDQWGVQRAKALTGSILSALQQAPNESAGSSASSLNQWIAERLHHE